MEKKVLVTQNVEQKGFMKMNQKWRGKVAPRMLE